MEKELDGETTSKTSTNKRLEQFINLYPIQVKVNDDVRRGRFFQTELQGKN